MGWLIDGVIDWLAKAVLATLKALWGLLGGGLFVTPDVTGLPQVTAITDRSVMVVNVCFVLAVITAGVTVMTHETVQIRYGIGEVAPRLVFGWIASNFAIPLCQGLIELANALTQALTGDGITSTGSFEQMQRVVAAALTDTSNAFLLVVMGLIIAVLTGMLMVVWLVRLGVLIVWVGVAPIALACHATPYTDGAAKLWWRTGLGTPGHARHPVDLPQPEREPARAGPAPRPDRRDQPVHRLLPAVGRGEDPRHDAPLRHPQRPTQRRRPVPTHGPHPAGVPAVPAADPPRRWTRRRSSRRCPRRRRRRWRVGGDHGVPAGPR